jgi:hypothetical protein
MDARGASVLSQAEAELAVRIGALHVGLGDFPALRAARPDWLWLDPEDGYHPGLDLTLLMALRTLKVLFQATPPDAALDLRYGDYRGSHVPTLGRLASTQSIHMPSSQRTLPAEALAQRVAAAGWAVPPGAG